LRLDAHHSCSERYPLATLAAILKRNRFEGSILVADTVDFGALPEFVHGVVIAADRVDPRRLDGYQLDTRFRGLCCRMTAGPPDNLGELERRGLTLDVEDGLEWVPRIAGQFPALRVAIVHLGSPRVDHTVPADWERWAGALEAAARIPQVCCKLSGLTGLAASPWRAEDLRPYVHHALAVFGPDRLMFGSGWPANLPEHTWKESLAAFTQAIGARSMEVREQLLGGTAARFYGLAIQHGEA
jgi:L-fuconolactonase